MDRGSDKHCAMVARLCYGTDSIPNEHGTEFKVPLPGNQHQRGIADFTEPKSAIVAFEGTREYQAWPRNLDTKLSNIATLRKAMRRRCNGGLSAFFEFFREVQDAGVHNGFFNVLSESLPNLWEDLEKWLVGGGHDSTVRVVNVTGHSLGGALATLFACCVLGEIAVRNQGDKVKVRLVTFGSPRVLSQSACDFVKDKLDCQRYVNVVKGLPNIADVVTTLPPENLGFGHVGTSLRQEHEVSLEPEELTAKHFNCGLESAGGKMQELHSLDAYLRLLGTKLVIEGNSFYDAVTLTASMLPVLANFADSDRITQQFREIEGALLDRGVKEARDKVKELKAFWCSPLDHVLPEGSSATTCVPRLHEAHERALNRLRMIRDMAKLGAAALNGLGLGMLINDLNQLKGKVLENERQLKEIANDLDSCKEETHAILKLYSSESNKQDPDYRVIEFRVTNVRKQIDECMKRLDRLEIRIHGQVREVNDLRQRATALAFNSAMAGANIFTQKGRSAVDLIAGITQGIVAMQCVKIAVKDISEVEKQLEAQLEQVDKLREEAKAILDTLDNLRI